jgi:SAM-dependent methyltransferase
MNLTLDFYDKHANDLIKKYDKANLEQLYSFLTKYIKNGDNILDLGFGSGRDLKFMQTITSNIFGLDSCETFINNLKNNGFNGRVAKSILPNINLNELDFVPNKFDVITSIAVLMHLNILDINRSIINIKKKLVNNGMIIISYSLKRKIIDNRHFEPLSKDIITDLFQNNDFLEIDSFENLDVMNRNIIWVTQVFELR